VKPFHLLRLGVGCASVLAPIAIMTACESKDSSADNNPTPDASFDAAPPSMGDGSPTPDAGPRADGVIREVSFHQLTVAPENRPASVPAFSRNGQRVAFSVTGFGGAPNKIFTVDADGSNIKEVDSYVNGGNVARVAISEDGNTIASTDGTTTRIVDKNGALKNSIVYTDGVTVQVVLTANGSDAFMLNARDVGAVARGVHKMSAAGGAPVPVITPAQAAAAVSRPVTDIGSFASCTGGIGVSADGTKVISVVRVADSSAILTESGGVVKSLIGPLTEGNKLVINIGIGKDGTQVAYFVQANNPQTSEVGVIGFDGANRKKLLELGHGDGCDSPLTLSDDNKLLAIGHNASIYPTDGSEPWTLLAATGGIPTAPFFFIGDPDSSNTRSMSMSGDGKRFVYLSGTGGGQPQHIAIAELDETKLGAVPTVSEPRVSKPSITVMPQTFASVSAKAPSGALLGATMFTKGIVENSGIASAQVPLFDDGKNLDKTAGDGIFTSTESIRAATGAVIGPRTLRIKAETRDAASGKRAGHLVDFGPFAIAP
jgi:hypothetical protein